MIQGEPLQDWFMRTNAGMSDDLIWKKSAGVQVIWVRDILNAQVGRGLSYDARRALPKVIGTHRSKSTVLPVYVLEREDLGVAFLLRGNYYNWKLSVISQRPIDVDLTGLCATKAPREPEYTGNPLDPVYFEGFPQEYVFPHYEDSDKMKWSAEFSYLEEVVFAAIFLIMRSLQVVKPIVYTTAAEHKIELENERKNAL